RYVESACPCELRCIPGNYTDLCLLERLPSPLPDVTHYCPLRRNSVASPAENPFRNSPAEPPAIVTVAATPGKSNPRDEDPQTGEVRGGKPKPPEASLPLGGTVVRPSRGSLSSGPAAAAKSASPGPATGRACGRPSLPALPCRAARPAPGR